MRRLAGSAALLLAALALSAPPAQAALHPEQLEAGIGADVWSTSPEFKVYWRNVPAGAQPVSFEYRVRSAEGAVVRGPIARDWLHEGFKPVRVPPVPGRYTLELRLFDGREWGAWGSMTLLFDDTRPGAARPRAGARWVAGGTARLKVEHPAAPLPSSGIRGYAISVSREPGVHPCAAVERCTAEELDLGGGVGDDEIRLAGLGEGLHHVRVVAVSGAWLSSGTVSETALMVDSTVPEVTLTGAPAGWARGPVRVTASAFDRLSGMAALDAATPFTALSVDGAPPTIAAGAQVTATVGGDGVHPVAFYGRDAAGNTGDGQLGAPPPRTELVRIDGTPPAVAFVPHDPADPERIEAVVSDALSGPDAARGSIALRPAGSGWKLEPLPTQVHGDRLVARWDPDALPAGTYEFRATAYDRAGNRVTGARRADGSTMVLSSLLKERVEVSFGFGGRKMSWQRCTTRRSQRRCRAETIESFERRPANRMMRYGRRIPVAGILRRSDAAPLAGRRIALVERLAGGEERTTVVLTGADGSFFAKLAPGPCRLIEARFAGDRVLARAGGRRLTLRVPAGLRLRASTRAARIGGRPVVFSGRVGSTGVRIPRAGLSVELQFRLPGLPWSDFRTVRTDGLGRFRYRYAFSDDDSRGIRFLFRARVPEQAAWPYAPGTSLPVTVTGR